MTGRKTSPANPLAPPPSSPGAVPNLTPREFHAFYTRFMGLRFPLPVAEVLEWRYVIHHAVDRYREPPLTPDHREFRDKLAQAIDSFSIHKEHHRERLLKILAMLRELHYAHSLQSRTEEERLRARMRDNREARRRSVRYGLFSLLAAILGGILWLAAQPGWPVLALVLLAAWLSLDYFHSLPVLDREHAQLNKELNEVLRKRVSAIQWKGLIHKLALVLGFKQVHGVEVFRMQGEADQTAGWHH